MANIMRLGGGSGGGKPKKLLSSLTEGSVVSVLEDGKLVPFYVAKHNYESDLNGEGRTLLVRKGAHSARAWDAGNVNAYAESDIDAWLNGEYKNSLSGVVKAYIDRTTFEYTVGNGNKTVTTLQRSVFLLSFAEYGGSYSETNVEGEALPNASSLWPADHNGAYVSHWTRTPFTSNAILAIYYVADGSVSGAVNKSDIYARPAFTLPADMALRDKPFADGSWTLADEDILFDTETASTTAKAGVNYTNGIADLTPAQLNEIAAAISANPNINKDTSVVYYSKGDVHRKISAGDTQNITKNGASVVVNIIGFNHDDLKLGTVYGSPTATGKAGMTIQTVDCTDNKAMNINNDNSTSWANSSMRIYSMPGLLAELSEELQGAIKTVKKLTSAGNKSSTITVTEDKLFLLSEIEIFDSLTHSFSGEGSQYAYYKAGNSKVKKFNGSATGWWERSPAKDAISFCNVNNAGGAAGVNSGASAPIGVAFAYCI